MLPAKTADPRRGVSPAIFALVAICSMALLVPLLNKSIYRDDGATVYSARLSWGALWRESLVTDRVLLPYYALLHLWFDLSYNMNLRGRSRSSPMDSLLFSLGFSPLVWPAFGAVCSPSCSPAQIPS